VAELIALDNFTLTDLDTARAYLKATTTNYDEVIKACINRASAQIEMYCKRYFLKRLYDSSAGDPARPTMVLDGAGCPDIMAFEYPIITVTGITELYPDGVTTRVLNITGLQKRRGHIIHLPFDSFSMGYQNIQVRGVFGFDAVIHARERRALEAACLRWVQVMYQDQDAVIGRGTTFGVGGETVQLISGAMPADVMQAIAPFQRYV
jgi:hypothetical protein